MDNVVYEQILKNQEKLETKFDEMSKNHSNQYETIIEKYAKLEVKIDDIKGIRNDIKDLKNEHIKDTKETKEKIDVLENKIIVLENKEENIEKTTNQLYKYFISALVALAAAVVGYVIYQSTGISL